MQTIDKDRFMLDTGAQVTVIGTRIAARLRLDPAEPDFEVEIEGVTGDVVMTPGFYIESIEIPALGNWVTFKNVPVVLLDVSSPEGGTLDGIIGMNLFSEFNLVLQGGGLSMEEDPFLAFEPIATEDPNQ
jgi:predicted aspartyl protease